MHCVKVYTRSDTNVRVQRHPQVFHVLLCSCSVFWCVQGPTAATDDDTNVFSFTLKCSLQSNMSDYVSTEYSVGGYQNG